MALGRTAVGVRHLMQVIPEVWRPADTECTAVDGRDFAVEKSMTKLLGALLCALPLLTTGAAFAQKTTDTSVTWTRTAIFAAVNLPTTVFTVPATATKPYFLRQSFTTLSLGGSPSYSYCDLFLNGERVLPLMWGAVTDMNVPFKAGDAISVLCTYSGAYWTLVFSS